MEVESRPTQPIIKSTKTSINPDDPNTKTGAVLILFAYIDLLLYFPQVDSQAAAASEDNAYLAAAAIRFISFLVVQTSAICVILMVLRRSLTCMVFALLTIIAGEFLMVLSMIIFRARTCVLLRRYGSSCKTVLNYKEGMLSVGVILGCLGAVFLLIGLRNRSKSAQKYTIGIQQQPVQNVQPYNIPTIQLENQHPTQTGAPVNPEQPPSQLQPVTMTTNPSSQEPPPRSYRESAHSGNMDFGDYTKSQQMYRNSSHNSSSEAFDPNVLPPYGDEAHIPPRGSSPFEAHTPVQTHYQY